MKNELLQLGLQLNVICLEQFKLIVILTPNRPRWDSKPVRKIRISSVTAYPLHQTTRGVFEVNILGTRKCNGTRWNSSGGLEELERRRG